MADHQSGSSDSGQHEDFQPVGSLTLTVLYIAMLAAGFALVYFGELLARR